MLPELPRRWRIGGERGLVSSLFPPCIGPRVTPPLASKRGFFHSSSLLFFFFYSPLLCVTVHGISPSDADGHQASNQWARSSSARIVCHSRVTSGNDVSRSISIRNPIRRAAFPFFFSFLFFYFFLLDIFDYAIESRRREGGEEQSGRWNGWPNFLETLGS